MTDITFVAEVAKVQTLADGGIRLTLDLGESDTMQMAQLAECKRYGVALQINETVVQEDDKFRTRNRRKLHI